jgi:hypothetical protein
MNLFDNLKGQKWKKPLNILKMVFYKQILDFHSPIEIMNFYQNHWSILGSIGSTHGRTLRFNETNEKILQLSIDEGTE